MSWGLIRLWFWVVIVCATAQTDDGDSRIVNIPQGPVRGYRGPAGGFSFYNIPYATARERYKAATAPPTWSEPFEAVNRGIVCPQPRFGNSVVETREQECLVANIFVPDTNETMLPVIVKVHGGAFQVGNGNNDRYTTFVSMKNIIVVTFNYRVAILGFLCLGTEKIPGNAGMKDQVTLLRWVKQNIANFGGNPDDVTISGCSVGGASVGLLALSSLANGLFNKVICDSGASTGTFAVQTDPMENAKRGALALNFTDVDNIDALEEFYLKSPLDLLLSVLFRTNENAEVTFGPCVERDVGVEMFLSDSPYNIIKQGNYVRYPTLFGLTDMEGLNRIGQFPIWKDMMNEKFSDFLPGDLQFESEEQKEEVAKEVKEFYFGNQTVSEETVFGYIDFFTDAAFAYSTLFSVKLLHESGNNTMYLYEYSFTDENSPIIPGTEDARGANHCFQGRAVRDEDETIITEEFRNVKRIMREIWDNFVRTGQPSPPESTLPTWPRVTGNRYPHLSLGHTIELKGSLLEERTRFWDDIYSRHYLPPMPPRHANSASTLKNVWFVYSLIILLFMFYH